MKYVKFFPTILFVSLLLQSTLGFARSGPQGITLEGNILTAANLPEEAASVSFTIQVKSPGVESCVLYQESQTLNMTNSGGVFSLSIGSGARGGSGYESTSTVKSAFNNSTAALTGLNCASGSIYTPASNDKRLVMLTFDDGSGAQSITQALNVQTVPYAMYADTLQGNTPSNFIQVNTTTKAVSQANIESVFDSNADVTALVALINGTSTLYAQPGGSNAFTGAVSFTTAPTTSAAPTTSTSIVNKTYADGSIAGKAIDSTTLSSITAGTLPTGDVLSWSGTNWVASPSSDSTKLPLAGGTMTGAIAMGGKDITNTGYITIAGSHYLGLGVYTDTGEATLVGTLNSTYAGVTWYNSTSNQVKFWNGSTTVTLGAAGSGLQSLNGLTGNAQTFANGTTGTAPAFNSSGTTHTLNIPMASVAGTSAGLLSNTDYTTFGKSVLKDGTVAFTADESMGSHKLTNVTDPASAQDAATKNYADLHVAGLTLDPSFSTLVSASTGQGSLLTWDQAGNRWTAAQPATSGTVTSVGLSLPSIFTVTNSPVTSTGTLTGTLSSQTGNTVFAGPTSGSGVPSFRNLNITDLKSSVAGPLFVAPNCSASQTLTWTAVTDNFSCQSIGLLSWSAISSGLPTTLDGYGITDAVANAGGTPSIQSGIDSAKPSTPNAGAIFVASDTKTIYQYNSGAWVAIATSSGSGGTLTALTGDVSASGTGSVASTVNSVGTSTAANVHSAELAANAATSGNTASTIVKRDASGNFTAGTANLNSASLSSVVLKDSGSNTVTLQAPTTVTSSYVLKLPAAVGGLNQVLQTDASGNLSWTTPAQGNVTGVSVTGPITNTGSATVPNIGITMSGDATISTSGVLALKNTGTAGTYTKVTTDAQGRVTSATNIASGDVTTALGFTPVNRAGDTMTGALAMGGNNLTGVGSVTMNAQNTLLMGTYTTAQESTLLTALTNTSSDIGKTWYNSSSSQIKYWNGTAAITLGAAGSGLQSLNGLTGSTQTFANGTSGTAPAFVSSSTTHTLNIPMASSASVTGGLLSNTDYATFNKSILKDGTVAFTADQSMGSHKLTNVTDPASSQDAVTKNYADTKIATKAVAGTVATSLTGSAGNGFVLTWDQSGNQWTALAPASSGTVTSVGLTLPSIFTVAGSPVTSSGTLSATLANAAQNAVFAGPSSGGAGTPAFRGLASSDLPTVPVAKGGTGATSLTPNGLLMADGTGSSVSSPICGSGMGFVSNGTNFSCTAIPSATTGFVNGGNSFGANATFGTNDAYTLGLKTNGATQLTITSAGNVGIGTTAPAALLNVNGKALIGSSTLPSGSPGYGKLITSQGTSEVGISMSRTTSSSFSYLEAFDESSNPVFRLNENSILLIGSGMDVGIGRSASGVFEINSGTAGQYRDLNVRSLNPSGGSVGIGTTSPGAKLDVNGDGNFSGVMGLPGGISATPGFHFTTAGSQDNYGTNIGFGLDTNFNIVAALSDRGLRMVDKFGNTPWMTTNAGNTTQTGTLTVQGAGNSSFAGKVGIGTTSPTSTFAVAGNAVFSQFPVNPAASYSNLSATASVVLSSDSGYSHSGIQGSISPNIYGSYSGLLSGISGAASPNGSGYGISDLVGISGSTGGNAGSASTITNSSGVLGSAGAAVSTTVTNASALRAASNYVTSSGVLTRSYGIYLDPQTAGVSNWQLYSAGTSPSYFAGNLGVGTTAPGYKLDVSGDVNIASANVLRFGGTQVCATAGCTATSDRRLKEDIQPLQKALDDVLKLQGVTYNWIDKDKYGHGPQVGLIAQDLEKVYPQVVITDPKTGLKSVAYDHLISPVIEAIKALYGHILGIETEVASLKVENAKLKLQVADAKEKSDREIAEMKSRLERLEKIMNSK